MDKPFIEFENSKISDAHRLILYLSEKINLKWSDKYVALSNLSIYYTWKNIKKAFKKVKTPVQHEKMNSDYLVDHILYQIFKIIMIISSKTQENE